MTQIKYFNVWDVIDAHPTINFFFFIGGRGIGKTYSALKEAYLREYKIAYTRKTKEQLTLSCNPIANPYKAINHDMGIDIRVEKGKPPVLTEYRKGKPFRQIGYGLDVSTNGNVRGADFSDITHIIYDEFIDVSNNGRKKDVSRFYNLYETVNRNRELKGEPAVKAIMLSNANKLDDELLMSLDLPDILMNMRVQEDGTTIFIDEKRALYVQLIEADETLMNAKMNTSLYKLTKGTAFYEMAINNEFTNDYFGDTKRVDFKELIPIVAYEDIYFYRHKYLNLLYVAKRKAQCPEYDKNTYKAFMRDYGFRINMIVCNGNAIYQSYNVKLKAKAILNNKVV